MGIARAVVAETPVFLSYPVLSCPVRLVKLSGCSCPVLSLSRLAIRNHSSIRPFSPSKPMMTTPAKSPLGVRNTQASDPWPPAKLAGPCPAELRSSRIKVHPRYICTLVFTRWLGAQLPIRGKSCATRLGSVSSFSHAYVHANSLLFLSGQRSKRREEGRDKTKTKEEEKKQR